MKLKLIIVIYSLYLFKLDYDVSEFKGKKNLIVTTMGPFGTNNQVLPISFLVLGFVELLIAGLFFYKYKSTGGKFGGKFKVM